MRAQQVESNAALLSTCYDLALVLPDVQVDVETREAEMEDDADATGPDDDLSQRPEPERGGVLCPSPAVLSELGELWASAAYQSARGQPVWLSIRYGKSMAQSLCIV